MTKLSRESDTGGRLTPAGRRRSPIGGFFLIFLALVLIKSVTASLAVADSQGTPPVKGTNSMPQAATVTVRDVPPLDKSQPSRVETFTFGLG